MNFDKLGKPRPVENSGKDQEIEQLSGLRRVGDALIDAGRQVSYPLALLGTFFAHEAAYGIEIPKHASLSEGVELLQKGALTERIETAASFVTLPNGSTIWYSVEGETDSVDLYSRYDGTFEEKITAFIRTLASEHRVRRGEKIVIDNYHNHPWKSYLVKFHLPDDFTKGSSFSVPPSGEGFLESSGQLEDVDFSKQQIIGEAVGRIEKDLGISISFHRHVVDAQGTWKFSFKDAKELEGDTIFSAKQESDELQRRLEENGPILAHEAYQELSRRMYRQYGIVRNAMMNLDKARNQWIDLSYEGKTNSSAHQQLVEAFSNVGVRISYEPFDKK